jgi:hypothetical protein
LASPSHLEVEVAMLEVVQALGRREHAGRRELLPESGRRPRALRGLAADVKVIQTPLGIFHQWFSIQNILRGA